jgi:hypothetical protein
MTPEEALALVLMSEGIAVENFGSIGAADQWVPDLEAARRVLAALPRDWCGHRRLADHELIPLLESCTYDIPISSGDVAVLSSRLAHSPVRMALAPEETRVTRADASSPLRAEGAPGEGARLG